MKIVDKSADAAIVANMNYVWDGAEIIRSVDGISGLSKNYFKNGVEISGGASNNGKFFYTLDHLGSVREVVAASGDLQGRYDYSPFGMRESLEGSFEADFGFTGHHFHKKSGLVLTLYRAYDPNLGKWLSADPMERVTGNLAELLPEGANLYAYVGNKLINFYDPIGYWGIGVQANGNTTLSNGIGGAHIEGMDGAGYFDGGKDCDGTFGGFGSAGGSFGIGGMNSPNNPGKQKDGMRNPGINPSVGGFAGVGFGGFVTNADCPEDLNDLQRNINISMPGISVDISWGGGNVMVGVSGGPGIGYSASYQNTTTRGKSW